MLKIVNCNMESNINFEKFCYNNILNLLKNYKLKRKNRLKSNSNEI